MSRFTTGLSYSAQSRYRERLRQLAAINDTEMDTNWKRMSLRFGRIYGQDGSRLFEQTDANDLTKDLDLLRETVIDEGEEAMDIDREDDNGETRPLEPLSFRDFFGSSVDLTPSLLTIFDSYSTEEGNNNDAAENLSRSTMNITDSCAPQDNGGSKSETVCPKDTPGSTTGNELTVANDNKKRPLSISSTSSSASSTSSLPRQHRKKKANTSQGPDGLMPARCSAGDPYMDTLTDEELLADLPEESSTITEDDDLSYSNRSSQSVGSSLELSDPKARHISRVVSEILDTERTYVNFLEEIIEGYLAHVLQQGSNFRLSEEDTNALFGNVKEIHQFNRMFLAELEKCEEDAVRIAKCFVDHSKGFHIYTQYCTHYPRAVEVLTECMRKTVSAEAFRQRQKELGHALPLGSYLLKPVQRILKYHLLLQSILKHYDKERPGFDNIQDALSSMTDMAKHINEMKRKHEDAVRVQELQSMLYDWTGQDLTTFGELILESSFRMYGAKAGRQIFLFNSGLIIAKKKEDGTLACKAVIMCSNLMLIESIPKRPLSFHVIPFDNPKMQFTLQARSIQQKREWCQEIKRLILESYAINIPDKAKEIVLQQLGKDKDSNGLGSGESVDSGRVKHSAPGYLEKRKARRRSGSFMPEFSLLKPWKATKKDGASPKNSPPRRRKISAVELGSIAAKRVQEKQESCRTSERHRSQSLTSLDDLALESLKTSTFSKVQECEKEKEKSYDDTSNHAKRMSQVLDEEGLETQLDNQNSDWDQEVVSSVLQVPGVRRAESFKKAVNLHRLDSKVVKLKERSKPKLSVPRESMEVDSDSDTDSYLARNDDYVNLVFDNHHRVFPDEDSLYSNIVVAPPKLSPSNQPVNIYDELKPLRKSGVITNRHAEELTKWQQSRPRLYRRHTDTDAESSEKRKSVRELQKLFSDSEVRRPGMVQRMTDSNLFSLHKQSVISKFHSTPLKNAEEPIYDTVCNNRLNDSTVSVIANDNAIYDTLRVNKDGVVYDNVRYDPIGGEYASICVHPPKSPTPSYKNFTSAISKSSRSLSNDMDVTYDTLEDPWRKNYRSKLNKSKSESDYENLVLENPSALLESYSPPSSAEKERRNVIQRFATPPRSLSLDADNKQSETAEQRRTISRYATPPREVMHPELIHINAVAQKSFSNSNLNLSDTSSYDNVHSPLTSSRSLDGTPKREGKLAVERSRSRSDDTSPQPRSIRDIWHELERYIKMSPTGSKVPGYPGRESRMSSDSSSTSRSSTLESANSSAAASTPGRSRHKRSLSVDASLMRSSSTDKFVGSLKKISQNITSKLTRKNSQNSLTPAPSQDSLADEPSRTPINHIQKTVSKLARAYSRRVKTNKVLTSRKSEGDLPVPTNDEDRLNEMLLASKPGSSAIGARIAEKQPQIVLGGYTLCRARPARPVLSLHTNSDSDKFSHSAILDALADLSSSESEDEGTVVAGSRGELNNQSDKEQSPDTYESKLSNALEESDIFRDSAVYSDVDSPAEVSMTTQENEHSKRSRPRTSSAYEEVPRARSASAVETRRRLPGQGIQSRLRHLEQSCSYVKPESKIELKEGIRQRLKQLEDSSKGHNKSDTSLSCETDLHIPSVKDRQSMLVEEAFGQRKRSTSLPPEEICGILFSDQENSLQKGHVRNVAQKFQHES